MRLVIFFSLLFISVMALNSCYYDKEDLLYSTKDIPCTDTSAASYSQKIVPMFQQYCYRCHSGSFPSGGIVMGTYTADKAIAQNGKLYGSVSHAAGFSPMPQGMGKMTSCQVAAIKKWIDSGTPNN